MPGPAPDPCTVALEEPSATLQRSPLAAYSVYRIE